MHQDTRYLEAKKVTIIGAITNVFLGISKIVTGYLFHSHALVADGIHSFSDVLTDLMVVFASKFGSQDADISHPYGHQRIETAATFFLAFLLIITGSVIAWDAIDELLTATSTKPNWLALPVATLSIIVNEALFYYTHRIGKRIQSPLILANAWHHRSDSAAAFVVLIGLIGSLWGIVYLDAVAASIVGCIIIKMGWDYGWKSLKELVDTAVDPELLKTIEKTIESVSGIDKIHQLRSRMMGDDVFIDVHIQVAPYISVSEGHYIAQQVHHTLLTQIDRVKDVTVHVDPEDDEIAHPSINCPKRSQLEVEIIKPIRTHFPHLEFYTLHYLNGEIGLDMVFDVHFKDWDELHKMLTDMRLKHNAIKKIRLLGLQQNITMS